MKPSPGPSLAILLALAMLWPAAATASSSGASDAQAAPAVTTTGERASLSGDILKDAREVYLQTSRRLSPSYGYPRSIVDGCDWKTTYPSTWTSGFFAGVLWQLYGRFGEEELLEQAQRWTEGLETQASVSSHDLGFMINNSFGRGYRAAGIQGYREVTLRAAAELAGRFDPRVGAIKAWDSTANLKYPVLIDTMMNLEILFWAARNGGDPSLADIARTHANTTLRNHVRPDGTTFHVVDYEPSTGEIIKRGTVQGLFDGSTWSRGQAWALYGFTVAYRETGEAAYLDAACRTADAFILRLPEDGLPCWDFDAEVLPMHPRDTSAAAIAASGLWELASLVKQQSDGERYTAASLGLTARLSCCDCSARAQGLPAMLLHATGNKPAGLEVDVPIIYADYYFVEALMRQTDVPHPFEPSHGASTTGVEGSAAATVMSCLAIGSFPNPFCETTRIDYDIPPPGGRAVIRIFSPSGRLVRTLTNADRRPGHHSVEWDGRDDRGARLAAGVHFCSIQVGESSASQKVALLR